MINTRLHLPSVWQPTKLWKRKRKRKKKKKTKKKKTQSHALSSTGLQKLKAVALCPVGSGLGFPWSQRKKNPTFKI